MSRFDLKILDTTVLRGPNRWSYKPAIEALVDIGELEAHPSNTLPGFVERLVAWLPGLHTHECSYEAPGGFVRRLEEGTWPGHILEHVTLELQTRIGHPVGFGRARSTSKEGVYHVVVRISQEDVTRACLLKARELVLAAIHDEPFDLPATLSELRALAEAKSLGPSTAMIVDAARAARIPIAPLEHGNLVLFGFGIRQRRIWTAETDRTSAIAESIAQDKDLAKELLARFGIPVPEGVIVRTEDSAWEAAQELGLPVVIKPAEGSRGVAVSLNLNTREEVIAAFTLSQTIQNAVIVERYIEGNEFRLLVVDNRVVGATGAVPFTVTGDGKLTVRQLITQALGAATSELWVADALAKHPTVKLALSRAQISFESVLAHGRQVTLPRPAKYGEDVLSKVHPDTLEMAVLATRVVGLDIAGVDLVAHDIAKPLGVQDGALVEVNAGPSLPTHLRAPGDESNRAGEAIARHLFPEGDDGRIPLVGITGCSDTTSVASMLGFLLHLHGQTVGVACGNGTFLGLRCVRRGDSSNWSGGQRVLINRTVNVAVLETSPTSLLREGLPYDRCKVGVVTSVAALPALNRYSVEEPAQVAHILRTQIDVVLGDGVAVLNADDPLVLAMAEHADGEVMLYSRDGDSEAIREAQLKGGRVVFLEGDALVFAEGEQRHRHLLAPCVNAGDCLPTAAAAWALGIPLDLIVGAIVGYPAALVDLNKPVARA